MSLQTAHRAPLAFALCVLVGTVACQDNTKPDPTPLPGSFKVDLSTPEVGITPQPGRVPGALIPGSLANAGQEDLVLIGDASKYLIERNVDGEKQQPADAKLPYAPGSIIDAQGDRGGRDGLLGLTTGYTLVGGNFIPIPYNNVRIYSEPGGGAVIAQATVPLQDTEVRFTQRTVLPQDQPHVIITTTVENVGRKTITLRIGDQIRFAPGHLHTSNGGEQRKPQTAKVSWLAHEFLPQGYGYTIDGDTPFNTAFYVSERGERAVTYGAETQTSPTRLNPDEPFTFTRRFLATGKGMPAIRAWLDALQGKPSGRISGQINTPSDLDPKSFEIALYKDKKLFGHIPVRSGLGFGIPVPPGAYTAKIKAPWGLRVPDQTVNVDPYKITRLDLEFPQLQPVRFKVVDADTNKPIPATLTFAQNGKPAWLGNGSNTNAAGSFSYVPQGTTDLLLPPGSWQVTASRGNEYSLDRAVMKVPTVFSPDPIEQTLKIKRILPTDGLIRSDLRVYSSYGPFGLASPEEVASALTASGVRFAVIADMDPQGVKTSKALQLAGRYGLRTIGGMTAEPYSPVIGLFTAIAPPNGPDNVPVPTKNTKTDDLFSAIQKLGTPKQKPYIFTSWPRTPGKTGYFDRFRLDPNTGIFRSSGASYDFQAVELFPGGSISDSSSGLPSVTSISKDWAMLLKRGRIFTPIASSGSARLGVDPVGLPFTYIDVGKRADSSTKPPNPSDILKALEQGKTILSTGPILRFDINGKGPGEQTSGSAVRATIKVISPQWMPFDRIQIFDQTSPVETLDVEPEFVGNLLVYTTTLTLNPESDTFYYARVTGKRFLPVYAPYKVVPFAMTNAIRVDANGDGVWKAQD